MSNTAVRTSPEVASRIGHKDYEKLVNNAPRKFNDADFTVGTVTHQGDVSFVRLSRLPKGAEKRLNFQLADGNTQGSRHILTKGRGVSVYDVNFEDYQKVVSESLKENKKSAKKFSLSEQLAGPVFVIKAEAEGTVTHPEHGHQTFGSDTEDWIVGCVFQRNLDAEEREARVRD